jgi:hypothetical protein
MRTSPDLGVGVFMEANFSARGGPTPPSIAIARMF